MYLAMICSSILYVIVMVGISVRRANGQPLPGDWAYIGGGISWLKVALGAVLAALLAVTALGYIEYMMREHNTPIFYMDARKHYDFVEKTTQYHLGLMDLVVLDIIDIIWYLDFTLSLRNLTRRKERTGISKILAVTACICCLGFVVVTILFCCKWMPRTSCFVSFLPFAILVVAFWLLGARRYYKQADVHNYCDRYDLNDGRKVRRGLGMGMTLMIIGVVGSGALVIIADLCMDILCALQRRA